MRLDSKQVIDIIGVTAIVASLIFVGLQLMLDRNVSIAAQYAARSESLKADLRTRMESSGYMSSRISSWESGSRPLYWSEEMEEFSIEQGFSSAYLPYLLITYDIRVLHIDNLYYQYTKGLLDESFWNGQMRTLKEEFQDPLIRASYLRNPRSLKQLLDNLVLELGEE